MNKIERDIFVLRNRGDFERISYVQGTNTIPLVFHLRDYAVPSGAIARVYVRRPDGTAEYDTAVLSGSDVTVNVKTTMFSVVGESKLQIQVKKGENNLVSFVIRVDVEKNYADGNVKSENATDIFDEKFIEIGNATKEANASASAAAKSAAAAKTSETNAAASAGTATSKATAAANSATAAKTSETNAAASAGTATSKATAAANSATTASQKAAAAANSATAANLSEINSAASATAADQSADEAEDYANKSKSYAIGTDNVTRPNDTTDNAKAYYELAKTLVKKGEELFDMAQKVVAAATQGALIPAGTIVYGKLPDTANVGTMYNISNDFTTDARFAEGAGIYYKAGANVYMAGDGKWDVMMGTQVTGVKGNKETVYRVGDVNLTPANIGALPENANAVSSSKWQTSRNINGLVVDGTANRANYGTCSTAAATVAKTVACTGFALATGAEIAVKFTVTNTAANPTLNVNGTGAKPIYYRGAAISAGYLAANRTYSFRYNGTQYELVGDINVDTDTKYSNMTAATVSAAGKAGLVPAPSAGAQGKYLTGAGTWEDAKDHTITFSQAAERVNIKSGDSIATALGKMAKLYADLEGKSAFYTVTDSFPVTADNVLLSGKATSDLVRVLDPKKDFSINGLGGDAADNGFITGKVVRAGTYNIEGMPNSHEGYFLAFGGAQLFMDCWNSSIYYRHLWYGTQSSWRRSPYVDRANYTDYITVAAGATIDIPVTWTTWIDKPVLIANVVSEGSSWILAYIGFVNVSHTSATMKIRNAGTANIDPSYKIRIAWMVMENIG